jgi:hypothetical protein
MTEQEHIAALYSRLNALRLNMADAMALAKRGLNQEAERRLNTAFAIDEKAANAMARKLYPKGE